MIPTSKYPVHILVPASPTLIPPYGLTSTTLRASGCGLDRAGPLYLFVAPAHHTQTHLIGTIHHSQLDTRK